MVRQRKRSERRAQRRAGGRVLAAWGGGGGGGWGSEAGEKGPGDIPQGSGDSLVGSEEQML